MPLFSFQKGGGRKIAISYYASRSTGVGASPFPASGSPGLLEESNLGASPRSWPISAVSVAGPCSPAPMEGSGSPQADMGRCQQCSIVRSDNDSTMELGPGYCVYTGVEAMSVED